MIKRSFTKDEIFDLICDSSPVSTSSWKFGTYQTFVLSIDGEHWQIEVQVHYDDGIQDKFPIEAVKVHEVERTVKVWEPV